MFVERMEVLEYRPKFEVELSTFPDSTNIETQRKLVFSLTCVSVSLCDKVCQWISYQTVDRLGWKLRCMLQLASNREPPMTSTIGPLFPPNLGRGWFLQFFEPLYLENQKRYRKIEYTSRRKISRSTNLIPYIFSISLTVFEIFWKKTAFEKSFQGLGVAKTAWLGSKHVLNICLEWKSRVSPGRCSRGNIFPKLRVGLIFTFLAPLYLKNGSIIKMCQESKLLKI